jgi:hypothetical protein
MQFIEKNSFNVQSAIYLLKSDNSNLRFALFPMIHVGSKEYYDEVSRRLAQCDLILAEGVRSKKVEILTFSYRIVKKIKRMNLVTQREALKTSAFSEKFINADMDGRVFDERWASLPTILKAQLALIIPIYVIYLFIFGTRELIASHLAVDDLPSRDELLNYDQSFEPFDALILDERDRHLIGQIQKLHQTSDQGNKLVGIVYGARHMRTIVRFLMGKLSYRIIGAEWITVFDL